jgi:hypothetical protein
MNIASKRLRLEAHEVFAQHRAVASGRVLSQERLTGLHRRYDQAA